MSPTAAATSKRGSNSNDYGYSNARIRGMRARLLKKERLEHLLGVTDMQPLIQELMQTELAPFLEDTLIHGHTAASVDEALKNNLVATYRKVLGFLNDEAFNISTTLLGRWDVFNLKTVVRGKHLHLMAEEISEGLLPVGMLSQVDLDGLIGQGDIRGVVDLASTWELPQAPALRSGYLEYQKTGELADLELALDHYYADWAAQRLWVGGLQLVAALGALALFRHLLPSPGAAVRIHTVSADGAPRFRHLLERFRDVTGLPFLVNTSFNGLHEPIVCSPRDAVRVFYGTGLDVLVMSQFVLTK